MSNIYLLCEVLCCFESCGAQSVAEKTETRRLASSFAAVAIGSVSPVQVVLDFIELFLRQK